MNDNSCLSYFRRLLAGINEILSGENAKELENITKMLVWGDGHGEGPAANRSLKTTDVDAFSSRMSQKEGTDVA